MFYFQFLEGIVIPAGSHLIVPLYATHRNPKYWDEPYSYIPERFSPEECKKRPQYSYIPFHGGLRDCLGISIYFHRFFHYFNSKIIVNTFQVKIS